MPRKTPAVTRTPCKLSSLPVERIRHDVAAVAEPGRMPRPLTSLIGREADVAAVCALLVEDGHRLITMTGPGGVGKTRLALGVAAAIVDAFADGIALVELAPVRDPALVPAALAAALGVPDRGSRPLRETLIGALEERELLLMLDNCEHVLTAAPLVADLLSHCPWLRVLATSRAPLGLAGERLRAVAPLALPAEGHPGPNFGPAVTLFVARAHDVAPGFCLSESNAATILAICRRLDGLPLAIELAAARLRVLSPSELLGRLDRALPLLTSGPRDAPERQQTLRQTIAWSYNLLDVDDQAVFRHLGLFTSGFTLAAAETMIAAALPVTAARAVTGTEEGDVFHTGKTAVDHLTALVDSSLLQLRARPGRETSPPVEGKSRFVMLETVREFALEHLAGRGEQTAAANAHATYYLALTEREAPDPCRHHDLLDRLELFEAEHANLRQAIDHLVKINPEAGLRLAGQLAWFWYLRSHLSVGRGCLDRALAGGEGAPPEVRAFALAGLGQMSLYQGDLVAAEEAFAQSLDLAHHAGDRGVIAYAVQGQAVLAMVRGNVAAAVRLGLQSADQYEEAGDRAHTVVGRFIAARALLNGGELAEAEARFQALLVDSACVPYTEALGLANLGDITTRLGRHHDALKHYAAALEHLLAFGELWNVAKALEGIAGALGELGKPRTAAHLLGAAASLRHAIGTPPLPADLPEHERQRQALMEALGEAGFADAFAAGQMLAPEAAVAEATGAAALAVEAGAPIARPEPDRLSVLTPREHEVLRLLSTGHADKEIAAMLGISRRTASNHVAALRAKLAVHSRAAIAAIAVRNGLV